MRTLLTRVPKSAQSFVATMVRTIFAQPDAGTVGEQHARIVDGCTARPSRRPSSALGASTAVQPGRAGGRAALGPVRGDGGPRRAALRRRRPQGRAMNL